MAIRTKKLTPGPQNFANYMQALRKLCKIQRKICKIYAKFIAKYVTLALNALKICKIYAKFNAKYVLMALIALNSCKTYALALILRKISGLNAIPT